MRAEVPQNTPEASERIDTWNRERTISELASFVQRRCQDVVDFDDVLV